MHRLQIIHFEIQINPLSLKYNPGKWGPSLTLLLLVNALDWDLGTQDSLPTHPF